MMLVVMMVTMRVMTMMRRKLPLFKTSSADL
uniref:Protein tyrosine phosphatase, receptor type, N polypeptide 2 n=1 Tax=Nothobranchius pienaari TaxID=704102 RepID=A0A1A8NQ92_9TELE